MNDQHRHELAWHLSAGVSLQLWDLTGAQPPTGFTEGLTAHLDGWLNNVAMRDVNAHGAYLLTAQDAVQDGYARKGDAS